jgi:ABC-type methionine transport system ATPase subunit
MVEIKKIKKKKNWKIETLKMTLFKVLILNCKSGEISGVISEVFPYI